MYVEGVDAKVLRIIRTLLLELSDDYDNLFNLYFKSILCSSKGKRRKKEGKDG
jgi:hypothetical protein